MSAMNSLRDSAGLHTMIFSTSRHYLAYALTFASELTQLFDITQ